MPPPTMPALLVQPHGFECFGAVEEDSGAGNLAVDDLIHVRAVHWRSDAATAPAGREVHERQHTIGVNWFQPLDRDVELGSSVVNVGEEAPNANGPVVYPAEQWRPQLDILGAAGEVALHVAVIERGHYSLDDVHVLLRHRLLLQPHGFEGLVA